MIKANHDYVVTVKKNQPKLYQAFSKLETSKIIDFIATKSKQKGRIEHRHTSLYHCPKRVRDNWFGAKRMIVMRRFGTRGGKSYDYTHYYLSSVNCDKANYFAKGIREHWSIENKLHWVKDVQMNEDNSMICNVNASQALSILKSLALNIYRINGYKKYKPAVEIFINRLDKLKTLFRT